MSPIPIVLLGYNRPESLSRALEALRRATYPAGLSITLYINLDNGGPNGTGEIADSFEWPFGPKRIIKRSSRLGMRENSLLSGDISLKSGAVIFIEDDTYVAPTFYQYATQAVAAYENDSSVFAVSLYSFRVCEFDQLRFEPLSDGYDNYFISSATTWATVWMGSQWRAFRDWLEKQQSVPVESSDPLPSAVADWPLTSWKKYVNKYIAVEGLYFVYPRTSFATNFADAGAHFAGGSNIFRVPLAVKSLGLRLSSLRGSGAVYDPFFELEPHCLGDTLAGIPTDRLELDLRGFKTEQMKIRKEYVVTMRRAVEPVASFSASFFPPEENLIFQLAGAEIGRASCRERV